jgi:hypothetical protein
LIKDAPVRQKTERRAATKVCFYNFKILIKFSKFFFYFFPQKIDYSAILKDSDESGSEKEESEPEMFDNVLEASSGPEIINTTAMSQSEEEEEETSAKPPPKRKLGPKPVAGGAKRKIETSDSESSPIKKKVREFNNIFECIAFNFLKNFFTARSEEKEENC